MSGFDLGDPFGSGKGGEVKLLTREEIMKRSERFTTDERTGESLIIIPKDSELGEAITARHTHGCCKHFRLEQGQQDCQDQRFWERMLQDERYRREWFDNPSTYGVCPYFEGRLMGFLHPALVNAGDLDSSLRGTPAEMEKKQCPYFVDRQRSGSCMVMGRYHKTNLEHV